MIPGPRRSKGGAAQLGVTQTGQRGPFGVRGEEQEPEVEHHAAADVQPGPKTDQPSGTAEGGSAVPSR